MNKIVAIAACVVLTQTNIARGQFRPQRAEIGLQVCDEQGIAIAGANVYAGYSSKAVQGITDSSGMYHFAETADGELYARVRKGGYYQTSGLLWNGPSSAGLTPPANVYTVVLKRIVNPVAMPERQLSLEFPELDRPVGLDLAAGDWVEPHGKGTVADMWILGHKDLQDDRNWEFRCQWQFTNDNGLVVHRSPGEASIALASQLTPPQQAPSDGYTNQYDFFKWYHAGRGSQRSAGADEHLIFRVRCQRDASGKILSENVGWIKGGMSVEGRDTKTMWIRFNYYFNPDSHSHSLEPDEIAKRQEAR